MFFALAFWQTVVWQYVYTKVRSTRLKLDFALSRAQWVVIAKQFLLCTVSGSNFTMDNLQVIFYSFSVRKKSSEFQNTAFLLVSILTCEHGGSMAKSAFVASLACFHYMPLEIQPHMLDLKNSFKLFAI